MMDKTYARLSDERRVRGVGEGKRGKSKIQIGSGFRCRGYINGRDIRGRRMFYRGHYYLSPG